MGKGRKHGHDTQPLGPWNAHFCCPFWQESLHLEFATLALQMAQNPMTGLKGPYSLPHTHLPGHLTSSTSILIMMRRYWVFALERSSPLGWAGALRTCPPALIELPAAPSSVW